MALRLTAALEWVANAFSIEPGQTVDLGDIRIKPRD